MSAEEEGICVLSVSLLECLCILVNLASFLSSCNIDAHSEQHGCGDMKWCTNLGVKCSEMISLDMHTSLFVVPVVAVVTVVHHVKIVEALNVVHVGNVV